MQRLRYRPNSLVTLAEHPWYVWLILVLAALLLAVAPLQIAGALIAALSGVIVILIWPVLGLYALAVAIPFGPVLRLEMGTVSAGLTDLLLAATLGAWFMQLVVARGSIRRSPLLILLLPFLTVLIFSTLAAESLEQAIPELVKWLEMSVIYFLGVQLLVKKHHLPFALTILGAASIEALIGVRQFLFRIGPEAYELGPFLRAYGTFGQPNPFAGYLGLVLPLGLALSLWSLERMWNRRQEPSQALRASLLALVTLTFTLIIVGGVVASWSRGAWVGVAFSSIAVLALYSFTGRAALVLAAAGLALAFPAFPLSIRSRLNDIAIYFGTWNARGVVVTDENFSVIERVAYWQAAWEMFADRPWLGIGVGNWDVVYPDYAIEQWSDPMGHAHNVIFHYAAVGGIIGLLAYLWMWLGSLVAAFIAIYRNSGCERAIAIGVFGLLIHLSIHNQLDNLWVQGMPLLIALALSLLVLHPEKA